MIYINYSAEILFYINNSQITNISTIELPGLSILLNT